jgi:hypothetical protein
MTKEEIIKLAGHRQVPAWVMKLVGDAVAKEREECVKIVMEGTGEPVQTRTLEILKQERERIAEAIRNKE